MVYLLEQTVRSPQTAAMLLHQDSGREMVQITVNNPDIDGILVRDLRLPIDVLLLDVNRRGNPIVPHGYTSCISRTRSRSLAVVTAWTKSS